MLNVRKYFAKTAREALNLLKADLGVDAIVLANRKVTGGVEIVALPPDSMSDLSQNVQANRNHAAPKNAPSRSDRAPSPNVRIEPSEHSTQPASAAPRHHEWVDDEQEDFHLNLSANSREALAATERSVLRQDNELTQRLKEIEQNGGSLSREDFVRAARNARGQDQTPAQAQAPRGRNGAEENLNKPVIRPFNPPRIQTPVVTNPMVKHSALMEQISRVNPGAAEVAMPASVQSSGVANENLAAQAATAAHVQADVIEPKEAADLIAQAEEMLAQQGQAQDGRPGAVNVDVHVLSHMKELEDDNARLLAEVGSLKSLLERQLAGFAWSELSRQAPVRTHLMSDLLEAGFSPQLVHRLTDQLGQSVAMLEARQKVCELLGKELHLVGSDTEILDQGGAYALIGPTGVGKTTTTAKLAARCVVRHGSDKVALITTDGYRIGAQEQLRIYGRILGVAVHRVRDAMELRQTLHDLKQKHIVLIDTIGMSHRDCMLAEQVAMLVGAGNVKRLLLLNASCQSDTLDDIVRAYSGPGLIGCILSKVDEAASLGAVLDAVVRHQLNVYYVANGQRVPEDFHLPNRQYLLHRALKDIPANSPYKLDVADAGLRIAAEQTKRPLV